MNWPAEDPQLFVDYDDQGQLFVTLPGTSGWSEKQAAAQALYLSLTKEQRLALRADPLKMSLEAFEG